jgi:hypothetical protein
MISDGSAALRQRMRMGVPHHLLACLHTRSARDNKCPHASHARRSNGGSGLGNYQGPTRFLKTAGCAGVHSKRISALDCETRTRVAVSDHVSQVLGGEEPIFADVRSDNISADSASSKGSGPDRTMSSCAKINTPSHVDEIGLIEDKILSISRMFGQVTCVPHPVDPNLDHPVIFVLRLRQQIASRR